MSNNKGSAMCNDIKKVIANETSLSNADCAHTMSNEMLDMLEQYVAQNPDKVFYASIRNTVHEKTSTHAHRSMLAILNGMSLDWYEFRYPQIIKSIYVGQDDIFTAQCRSGKGKRWCSFSIEAI
jgi:hypothetical protein